MNVEQEITELKARIATLEAERPRKPAPAPDNDLPFGRYRDPCGIERDGRGAVVVRDDSPSYEDRMAARREFDEASEDRLWAEKTKGLPPEGPIRPRA